MASPSLLCTTYASLYFITDSSRSKIPSFLKIEEVRDRLGFVAEILILGNSIFSAV